MKLKRHHLRQTPAQDLAASIQELASVLERNIENGVLAQGAMAMSDDTRARLFAAIDHAMASLDRTRQVLTMVATLSQQLCETPQAFVEGYLEDDDIHIRLTRET